MKYLSTIRLETPKILTAYFFWWGCGRANTLRFSWFGNTYWNEHTHFICGAYILLSKIYLKNTLAKIKTYIFQISDLAIFNLNKKDYFYSVVTRDFSTCSIRDKTDRQKISKEIEDLNDTICQLDLTSIYWIHNSDVQDHIVCEQR